MPENEKHVAASVAVAVLGDVTVGALRNTIPATRLRPTSILLRPP